MILTIIRGLPGSGKTTAARTMQQATGALLIEPDMLCIEHGEYQYTPERYAAAIERTYCLLELLTGAEFDRKSAVLRPDLIYTDVLPLAGDIMSLLSHVNPEYTVNLITLPAPDLTHNRNVHQVKPRDLARMYRIFEAVELDHGKLICHGRMWSV